MCCLLLKIITKCILAIGTKNNAYKHQTYFFSNVPKKYGEKSTKNDAKYSCALKTQSRSTIGPIKIINNKIFCSLLCVLSVGKALFLPRFSANNYCKLPFLRG